MGNLGGKSRLWCLAVVGMWLCFWKAREAGGLRRFGGSSGEPGHLKFGRKPSHRTSALGATCSPASSRSATRGQCSHTMEGHLPWVPPPAPDPRGPPVRNGRGTLGCVLQVQRETEQAAYRLRAGKERRLTWAALRWSPCSSRALGPLRHRLLGRSRQSTSGEAGLVREGRPAAPAAHSTWSLVPCPRVPFLATARLPHVRARSRCLGRNHPGREVGSHRGFGFLIPDDMKPLFRCYWPFACRPRRNVSVPRLFPCIVFSLSFQVWDLFNFGAWC